MCKCALQRHCSELRPHQLMTPIIFTMSLLGVLFKSIIILSFLLVLGELACDNYTAYHSSKQAPVADLPSDDNQTAIPQQAPAWEPVAVTKKSLENVVGKAVRLQWEQFSVYVWLNKQGPVYLLCAVGIAAIIVLYYRNRLAKGIKRQGDSFSKAGRYGGVTTKEMNKLYNDQRFREWRRDKLEKGEQEQEDDDGFAEEWREKEDEIYDE